MSLVQSLKPRGGGFCRASITSAPKSFGAAWEYFPLCPSGEVQDSLQPCQPKAEASGTREICRSGGQVIYLISQNKPPRC